MAKEYLAKSDGTTLYEHSCRVCDMAISILDDAGITDRAIRTAVMTAALSHDMGKTMPSYQEFIRKTVEIQEKEPYTDNFPRHNEVSASLFKYMVRTALGPSYQNLIAAAIEYHHTCTGIITTLDEIYGLEDIPEICTLYRNLFKKYSIEADVNDIDIDNMYPVSTTPQFSFIDPSLGNIAGNIHDLSLYKIIFDTVRYADLLVSSGEGYSIKRSNSELTDKDLLFPVTFNRSRWGRQIETTEKLNASNHVILKATMGFGKTLCGLRYLLSSDRLGIWVCPDNSVAQATFRNVTDTLNACGLTRIQVSLLLNGAWMEGCGENADIIVTNIDTYENGTFRNSRKAISFKCLYANTVFDEYHEYLMDNNPLSSLFLSIVRARTGMKSVKTLLMSGTMANNGFLNFGDENIIEVDDDMEKEKKVRFHYVEPDKIHDAVMYSGSHFVIYSAIKNCQKGYGKTGDICIHSRFDNADMEFKNTLLYKHNGKKSAEAEPLSVSSTSTISRAYDISFKTGFIVNPNPFQILQATGRINRWDYAGKVGDLYIIMDNSGLAKGIYLDRTNGKRFRYPLWDKIYRPYIEAFKKQFPDGSIGTVSEIDSFMNEYFEKNKTVRNISLMTLGSSLDKLKSVEFRKGSEVKASENNSRHSSDKMDVRGNTATRFMRVQLEGEKFGKLSGVLPLPSYAFGEEGFDALRDDTMASEIISYFSNNKEIASVYFGCKNLDSVLKNYKKKPKRLHDCLMRLSVSDETPYPIFGNYVYSRTIGFYKKERNN